MSQEYYAYRSYGDRAGTSERTMDSDPNTGEYPHLHSAGDVISFDSEEARDTYVSQRVVITTLQDGRHPKYHSVTSITTEKGQEFLADCTASPTCIHKSDMRQGSVRLP